MRAIASLVTGSLLAVFVVVGCRGGAPAGVATGAPIALTSYCDAVAEQSCERFAPCCEQAGYAVDVDACIADRRAECAAAVQTHQQQGHVYDPGAAGACLGGAADLYDGCVPRGGVFFGTQRTSDACARVWTGKAKAGEPCVEDADCALQPGAHVGCGGSGGKTCIAVPVAAAGQPCDTSGTTGTSIDCALGTACTPLSAIAGSDAGTSGGSVCMTPSALGGRCNGGVPTECQDGLWCAVGPGTCRPPGREGDSCEGVPCAAGFRCRYPEQVCHGPAPLGATCNSDGECAPGAGCRTSVCTALSPAGVACTWSGACASGRCDLTSSGHGTCIGDEPPGPGGFDTSMCGRAKR